MPGPSRVALRAVHAAGHALLDLIYPPRCAGCGRSGIWLCRACRAAITPCPGACCIRCGYPVGEPDCYCAACRQQDPALDGILSGGVFAPPLKPAIHHLKYHGARGLAGPLAEHMADVWRVTGLRADLIVPVPLHTSREAARGYNQAALLAGALAACLELPLGEEVVIRVRATASQVDLNPAERRANVRDAFKGRQDVSGQRILLIDDVCTTGATLEACAASLRSKGAASVFGLTAARVLP